MSDTQKAINLAPCPFCGGKKVKLTVDEELGRERFGIVCQGCGMDTTGWKDDRYLIKLWNTRPVSGEWIPTYDVNVKDIHHAIDILMEHIESADGNTAILICEINDEFHGNKLIQIQLRAESNPDLFIPAPPKGGE